MMSPPIVRHSALKNDARPASLGCSFDGSALGSLVSGSSASSSAHAPGLQKQRRLLDCGVINRLRMVRASSARCHGGAE